MMMSGGAVCLMPFKNPSVADCLCKLISSIALAVSMQIPAHLPLMSTCVCINEPQQRLAACNACHAATFVCVCVVPQELQRPRFCGFPHFECCACTNSRCTPILRVIAATSCCCVLHVHAQRWCETEFEHAFRELPLAASRRCPVAARHGTCCCQAQPQHCACCVPVAARLACPATQARCTSANFLRAVLMRQVQHFKLC